MWYADKRVEHDRIVPLEQRFKGLAERYGKNDGKKAEKIMSCFAPAKKIEEEIFSRIDADRDLKELERKQGAGGRA